jgi:glc operon protein GlcG
MRRTVISAAAAAVVLFAAAAHAEMAAPTTPAPAPAAPPVQYGQPGVTLEQAQAAAAAAVAEAKKNGWLMAVAVVSSSGFLVSFSKMDQTQFASVQIAMDKAKAAAQFRRPTKVFEDRANSGGPSVLSLHGVVASEGGVPLMRDGKVIGAIGCSGGTSQQDGLACKAGADTIK